MVESPSLHDIYGEADQPQLGWLDAELAEREAERQAALNSYVSTQEQLSPEQISAKIFADAFIVTRARDEHRNDFDLAA